MKICILSVDFLPNIGGIAAHVYELSKSLVKQGHDVYLITEAHNGSKYEEIDGIKVYRIPFSKIRIIGFLKFILSHWLLIRSLIKHKNIDILHFHNLIPEGLVTKLFRNITIIATEHSSGFLEQLEDGKDEKLYHLLKHADHVIGPSNELVNNFVKIGIDPEKTSFIPNGVDVTKFDPNIENNSIRNLYKIDVNDKIILCPRRIVPKNGICFFIRSIPMIIEQDNNIKCLIVGSAPNRDYMEKLKNEISELKINDKIIFAGSIPNHKMPEYYAAADLVVLPSLKEATSIAGLEAMASGKPLIGTRVGGIPQIIDDNETGYLVPPKDPERLANTIISLLKDKQKRISMGLRGREKVENEFSWDIITKRTIEIYKNSLKKGKSKHK